MTTAVQRLYAQRTAVYRLFGKDGSLLYVGASKNIRSRLMDHRSKKPWWSEVKTFLFAWYPDRNAALQQESLAIAMESPRYNRNVGRIPERFVASAPRLSGPRDLKGLTWPEALRASGIGSVDGIPDDITLRAVSAEWRRWKREAMA